MSAAVQLLTRDYTFSSRTAPYLEGRPEEEVLCLTVMSVTARHVAVKGCGRIHGPVMESCIVVSVFKIGPSMFGRVHKKWKKEW